MPSKLKKKMRQGKRKEREGEKAKSESRKCCATFKPKNYVKILISLEALILHLAEKAGECNPLTTVAPLCNKNKG